MKKATLVILLLLLGTWGFTQLPLSLQTMMEKVIRQNRSIQVEREKWIADKQGVFRSNAGLGPTVEFAASGEYNVNNTSLELNTFEQGAASTQKIEENFATSMTHSIGPQLNYTLFDGGRGKGQYQQLQNTADLSKLQAQWYFDHTLLEATQLYLTIASMEQTLDILQSNIELSQERIDRAIINAKYAQGNDLSVLQARVDLNTDSIDYQNQQRNIDNAKEDLRNLMNEPKGFTFSTQALTTLPGLPTYDQLVTSATQQNPEVLLAQQGIVVEQQQLKILQADNRPQVTFSANAGLFRQDFEVGQLNYSQNIGVTGQIGIRYQVFDGKKRKRNQDIQRLHIQIKEEEKYIAIQEVLTNLEKSWNTYHTIKSQMDFEQRNLPFYEDNLALLRKNYKIGKANDTDLRSAQLSLTSAQISLSQKAIEQQMEHFKLLQLAGMLIQYPSQTREGLE